VVSDVRALPASEIARAVNRRELDPVEIVEIHAAAMPELDEFNALITSCAEEALERARGGVTGPLAGVPVLVKDMFDTAGVRTTYGSKIYADRLPVRTAAAVELLERAGAIVVGKANLHEFAWGTTSQNPHWGYVGNPARPGHVAGGSSGGNAAALAAGVGTLGLGTDTAGSIRIPSAACGTVGFKPPHGVVPTRGCMPLSPSFDVAGPMARSVADCALAYAVLGGHASPEPRLNGLIVGVLADPPAMSPFDPGGAPAGAVVPDISGVVPMLERLGARLEPAALAPPRVDLLPLMLAEAAASHVDTFPSRREEYGPDTQMKWESANAVSPEAVAAARVELARWRDEAAASGGPDLYVSPTLAGQVPMLDVWEPDVRVAMVGHARLFSFLGWPAVAIGGLQIAGRRADDVLAAALAWEEAYGPSDPMA
jgi:Asp-tRNA(Asn)/Glu-tRNA(Gln) amidotransferase A subunit family amidase